jgi:alkanesulfonate monooxygenase SsuD/methylene tetrahydromethanopterin reductase-like flavin-dependent oxidoreductase (luciferase family)
MVLFSRSVLALEIMRYWRRRQIRRTGPTTSRPNHKTGSENSVILPYCQYSPKSQAAKQKQAGGRLMKFGLFGGAAARRGGESADSAGYIHVLDVICEADKLGYHSVFMVEHHFTGIGQISATLSTLCYLAAKTKTIRLGTGVTVLPWHNPVLVAEQAATVDLLSNGRLDFGVGKGYRDLEFHGFRIPKEEAQERYDESLALILKSFTSDERFSHEGKYWQFDDILVEPPAVQKPHPPIWIAAGSDASIAAVARSGHNVMFDQFAGFERTCERLDIWKKTCADIGRAYDPMQVTVARGLTLVKTDKEYELALAARRDRNKQFVARFGNLPGQEGASAKPATQPQPHSYSDKLFAEESGAMIGKPEHVIKQLRAMQEAGFEYVIFTIPPDVETLRVFAKDVAPALEGELLAAE